MEIVLTEHALMRMNRRKIAEDDIKLILELGEHTEGKRPGTIEACVELDGRPITVVYDELYHRFRDIFRVVTVLIRRCPE